MKQREITYEFNPELKIVNFRKYNSAITCTKKENQKKLETMIREQDNATEKIYFFYLKTGEIKKPYEIFLQEDLKLSDYTLAEITINKDKKIKISNLYSFSSEKNLMTEIDECLPKLKNEKDFQQFKKDFFYKKISISHTKKEFPDLTIKLLVKNYNEKIETNKTTVKLPKTNIKIKKNKKELNSFYS